MRSRLTTLAVAFAAVATLTAAIRGPLLFDDFHGQAAATVISVDADTGVGGVNGTVSVPAGGTVRVRVTLESLGPAGYVGYQAKLLYDDTFLDAVGLPTSWNNLPTAATAGNVAAFPSGPDCGPAPGGNALQDNDVPGDTSEDDVGTNSILMYCNDNAVQPQSTLQDLVEFAFVCETAGAASVTLADLNDAQGGTNVTDSGFVPQLDTANGATIQCEAPPTPTPPPSATASPTPTATATPVTNDTDGDGLSDATEELVGTDPGDPDTDNDGLGDGQEVLNTLTSPLLPDTDGDGLSDGAEVSTYGTDPHVSDTDHDGLSDAAEVTVTATNPLDPDTDGDALYDGAEVNVFLTNPNDPDTDGDGLDDLVELLKGTDPADADSDNDTLTDGEEINTHGTSPLNPDTDGDGLSDAAEIHTTMTNPSDMDSDNDGISDGAEVLVNLTDPTDADTDGDSVLDGAEVLTHLSDPLDPDTDDDTLGDGYEVVRSCLHVLIDDGGADPDADLIATLGEAGIGTEPCDNDTDADGCADGEELGPFPALGGQRDPLNPFDLYDVNSSRSVTGTDHALVKSRFGTVAGDPTYDPVLDRTPLGPNFWNLGGPNGAITSQDVALVKAQFGHTCVALP